MFDDVRTSMLFGVLAKVLYQRQVKRRRHSFVSHIATMDVDCCCQRWVFGGSLFDRFIGTREGPEKSKVARRKHAGPSNGAWQIREAVMNDIFFNKS